MAFVASSQSERAGTWPASPGRAALAWRDIRDGWDKRWMWSALAVQDIKLRYRGSVLGPFWVTLSTLIMVLAMGVIYPHLFHVDVRTYIPYLAIGMIVWQLLTGLTVEGCETFLREESVIQQVPVPFSVHAYRCVCRNLLLFVHNLAILPLGLLVGLPFGWRLLEIVPGLALIAVNGLWLTIVLGMVSSRFRDVPPIVGSIMQVLFFLTPVMWPIDAMGDWKWLVGINPFFAAIDVVRAPMLGVTPLDNSWAILIGTTVFGLGLGFAVFARFRTRIAYWI